MAHDNQTAAPAFRADASLPFIDPETGLPPLANLSRETGIALVAGLLARIADMEGGYADVLVSVHPAQSRPVWARLEEGPDSEKIKVRSYLGHPTDSDAHVLGAASIGDAEATWYGGTVLACIHQAAEDVYYLIFRIAGERKGA